MPPFVRKPSMLGDPSVVAGWRFLAADDAAGTPRRLRAPQRQQQTSQRSDVETFLQAAEVKLGGDADADVDEDALVDRVEALLAGPEEEAVEPRRQRPQVASGRRSDRPPEDRAYGSKASRGVNFDEYVYSTAATTGGEGMGGGGTVAVAPSGLSLASSTDTGADPGTDAATPSPRPASRPFEEQPGTAASGAELTDRSDRHRDGCLLGRDKCLGPKHDHYHDSIRATAGTGRVGRTPRGARTGQVVPLPSIAVDSSFTYTPRQARARAPRYGAWYLPTKSWQKGGAPKPPPQLTKEQKEKIEQISQKRASLTAAAKTAACPIAFKEYLRHQRAREALEVLEQATALGPTLLDEIAAIKADFTSYKLSSRELQKRIRELLAGGPIQRQQLALQVGLSCLRTATRAICVARKPALTHNACAMRCSLLQSAKTTVTFQSSYAEPTRVCGVRMMNHVLCYVLLT